MMTINSAKPSDADELVGLAVWCVSIADHHADVLSPHQIEKLYAASDALRALSTLQPTSDADVEVAALERKLRNVVSHATGGACPDHAHLSLNEIGVHISKHHNRVWEQAQKAALPTPQPTEDSEPDGWRPITSAPNQTEVLVCNDCLLGWWAVAIQDALGEWHDAGGRFRSRLKYEPTHWQELPSIYPIALRRGKREQN